MKTKVRQSFRLILAFVVMLTMGLTAMAETVTYTVTGGNNSPTEFYAQFTGGSSTSNQVTWTYNSSSEISFNLRTNLTLTLTNSGKQLGYRDGLIGGQGSTTLTVSGNNQYYIYHVRLLDASGNVIQLDANGDAVTQGGVSQCDYWNMTKSLSRTFSNGILFSKIEVSFATSIPITDAVISGLSDSYIVSNAAVTPTPTVTWHGTTLTSGTHFTFSYQNNTAAGTATVTATGKGIFSSSTSANYTLVWATYSVRFNKNHNDAEGTMSDQAFYYTEEKALTATAFTRTGYTFTGWSTTPDGDVAYTDGQSVSNLTATNGATVDLYAQWKVIPWSGTGISGNPYIISYPSQLDLLAQNVNSGNEYGNTYFKLGADIAYDPNVLDANGENYTAIGNSSKNFCGIFDGDGHTVSGIRINKPSDNYQGLFGRVNGATVKNVTLNDARITGLRYVGGIAGQMNGSSAEIENCLVLNTAITANNYHGAVVGYRNYGTLNNNHYRNCTVNGNTTGVGCNGIDRDGARSVHALTLPAGVTATGESVEIDGTTYYASNTIVTLSYSAPEGYQVVYSVNGTPIDGIDGSGNKLYFPAADANVTITITDVWGITGGADGTEDHPYIITTTAGLDLLAQNVNSGNEYGNTYFKLGADIAYPHTTDWDDANSTENNYTAIGTSEKAFCGIFDGDGHTVSGIRINKPSDDYQGLFGRVYGATVKNVTLNDARITGFWDVGGISGQMNGNATIENCLVLNTAITANSYRGAVVGYRINGTLNNNHYRNCTVNGNTTGVGCNGSDRDGARSVHALTLHAGVTATGESVVIDGVTYYASNTTITLSYSDSAPEGYQVVYSVNGTPISGNSFTMPAADATISRAVAFIDVADNSNVISSNNGETVDVVLSGRTLYRDGDWNTLCLPFSLTAEQVAASPLAGCTLMELDTDAGSYEHITGFENNTLYLNFKTATSIEAGTPYIVKCYPAQPDLTISSESDWNTFCTNVNNGTSYSGMTVRLAADISVSRMVGTYNYPFKGTFDGDGHTLTVTLNNNGDTGTDDRNNGVAPFRFTYGATIKNLHVGGTITTSTRKYAAGIVGMTKDDTNNIQNCRVSADIYSTIDGDGTHGGFVGKACGTVNISNCLFDGVLTTDEGNITNSCGGFVGWRDDPCSLSISNSLYSPAEIPSGKYAIGTDNSCTFTRNNNNNCISNCYYTETLGEAQGTDASAMSNSELLTALGDGWEISNGKVVPKVTNDIVNPAFPNVTIDNSAAAQARNTVTSNDGKVSFCGNYSPVTLTGGDRSVLYLGSNNKLYFPAADRTMGAFRAYFQLDLDAASSPVKAFVLNFNDDDATSLNEELRMKSEEFATAREWYDLSGRKLSGKPGKRGIYIRDGKKIILK